MHYNPIQSSQISKRFKLLNVLWSIVNASIYRYSPFFFRKFRIFLVRIFGAKVDWSCSLNRLSIIDFPWNLYMGKNSSIGENSWIYCLNRVEIEDFVCIGKDSYILTGSHDINSLNFDLVTKPVSVKKGVWISTGVYILPGIIVEEFSVIGAGSVLTKSTVPFGVYGGNPAKFLNTRSFK